VITVRALLMTGEPTSVIAGLSKVTVLPG